MSLLKRLHREESAKFTENAPVEPAQKPVGLPPASSMMDDFERLLELGGTETADSPASVAVSAVPAAERPEPVQLPIEPSAEPKLAPPAQPLGVLADKSAKDYTVVLQSLAPVFRAVSVFPGHDAAPEVVAEAVKRMSLASAGLAEHIAKRVDHLELDSGWSRKHLHGFTADLVSGHWVSSVIARGGMPAGTYPDVSIDYFSAAIEGAWKATVDSPVRSQNTRQSLAVAMSLAMLTAIAPISLEVERYATMISAHVPGKHIDPEELVRDLAQFIGVQVQRYSAKVEQSLPGINGEERQELILALIRHASGVVLSSWEFFRGEVLGALKDTATIEEAAAVLTREQFQHGFPLADLKSRAAVSLARLIGTTEYALTMMRVAKESGHE